MRKHTDGPFEFSKRQDGDYEITKDGDVMATVYGDDLDESCWPAQANAALFAAVPDLLEALKLVLIFHDGGLWTSEKAQEWANGLTRLMGTAIERRDIPSNEATTKNLCNAVRAALAKATKANP